MYRIHPSCHEIKDPLKSSTPMKSRWCGPRDFQGFMKALLFPEEYISLSF